MINSNSKQVGTAQRIAKALTILYLTQRWRLLLQILVFYLSFLDLTLKYELWNIILFVYLPVWSIYRAHKVNTFPTHCTAALKTLIDPIKPSEVLQARKVWSEAMFQSVWQLSKRKSFLHVIFFPKGHTITREKSNNTQNSVSGKLGF